MLVILWGHELGSWWLWCRLVRCCGGCCCGGVGLVVVVVVVVVVIPWLWRVGRVVWCCPHFNPVVLCDVTPVGPCGAGGVHGTPNGAPLREGAASLVRSRRRSMRNIREAMTLWRDGGKGGVKDEP